MIQTQTFALDDATKAHLSLLVRLISLNRNEPEKLARLIAEHDDILKRAQAKPYIPGEDA